MASVGQVHRLPTSLCPYFCITFNTANSPMLPLTHTIGILTLIRVFFALTGNVMVMVNRTDLFERPPHQMWHLHEKHSINCKWPSVSINPKIAKQMKHTTQSLTTPRPKHDNTSTNQGNPATHQIPHIRLGTDPSNKQLIKNESTRKKPPFAA